MKTLFIQYHFRQPILWGLTWGRWSDVQTIFAQIQIEEINTTSVWRLDLELDIQRLLNEKMRSQGIDFCQIFLYSITQIQ